VEIADRLHSHRRLGTLISGVACGCPADIITCRPRWQAPIFARPDTALRAVEAKRVSGGALLVSLRIVNGAGTGGGGLVSTTRKTGDPYTFEPPANWWPPLRSSEEERDSVDGPGTSSDYR